MSPPKNPGRFTTRKVQGTKSQSIRLTPEAVAELAKIIATHFE
jgi:hypothetical protein